MQSTKPQLGVLVRISMVLLALLALLTAYYWSHKPFDLQIFARLGGAVLDVLTVGALFAVGGAVGRAFVSGLASRLSLDLSLLSRAQRFALETAFGLMLIAVAALGLGMVGLFRSLFFWLPLLLLVVLLRRHARSWFDDIRALMLAARPQSRWGWLLAAFSAAMLVLALLHSLAPPYSWDSMTYHLVGPQHYLADGRMSPQPDNFYVGFPKSIEMLFSVAMSLFGRDTAAAPVHFGFGLLGFLAVAGMVRRYTNSVDIALLGAVFLLSSYSVWVIMGWSYVDLAVMTMSALAFSLANVWRETKQQNWLILMGLASGFALGIKYTSGLLTAVLCLYILVYQPRQVIRNGLIFGVAVVIAFLPWMIRGALHYGNPIYPYLFDGLNWDAERAFLFNQVGKGMISLGQAWQLPLLPLTATVFGVDNTEPYGFTVSPWLFTLPFLFLFLWQWTPSRSRGLVLGAALIELPLFIFWALMAANNGIAMQTRLMIMLLPVSAVLGAVLVHVLSLMPEKPVHLSFIVRALITVTMVLVLKDAFAEFDRARVGSYLLGEISRDDYLFGHLVTYPSVIESLDALPEGSQVRFLWEPRSYYCPQSIACIPDVLFDQWSGLLSPAFLPDAVFQQWRQSGDDYVLFFRHGYGAYVSYIGHRPEENAIIPDMLEQYLAEVWTTPDSRYTLYTWAENGENP